MEVSKRLCGILVSLFLITPVLSARPPVSGPDNSGILFFCAVALRAPVEELAGSYGAKTGTPVEVIYGGSGAIMARMELARRGDVYMSASPDYIQKAEDKKIKAGPVRKAAFMAPTIVVRKGNPQNIRDLNDLARPDVRVALANPETAAIGLYAVEIFERNRLIEKILPNVMVFPKDISDTLSLLLMDSADVTVGWDALVRQNPDALQSVGIPPEKIPRASYAPVFYTVYARDPASAAAFVDYLVSEESSAVWKKWGYITEESELRAVAPSAVMDGEYKLPSAYYSILRRGKRRAR